MQSAVSVERRIFKSYDVRGRYGDEVNEAVADLIGRALVHTLSATSIAVGRDMRDHSPRLEAALIGGGVARTALKGPSHFGR